MLVVICLIGMIFAFGAMMSMDAYRGFSFRNDRDAVVAALQRARSQSINNVCLGSGCTDGRPHGVHFDPDAKEVVIFQGSDWSSPDSDVDEKISFESKATTVTGATQDVVFDQLSGDSASATITLNDGAGRSTDITINSVGQIDYGQVSH
jgi:Tfp pilus assembly protein FimT